MFLKGSVEGESLNPQNHRPPLEPLLSPDLPYKISVVEIMEVHSVTEHHVGQQLLKPGHVLGMGRRLYVKQDEWCA